MDPLSVAAALTIPAAIAYAWWRKAPLSLTFAVAIILVYALGYAASLTDPPFGGFRFQLELSLSQLPYFGHSGPWTYVTSLFVHANFLHLAFNLLFLFLLGPMLEDRIGSLRWGILFLVGGVVAAAGFELVRWGSSYILLGASGALSAVFGAFGRLYPRERISMWVPVPLPPLPAIYYVLGFLVVETLLAFAPFTADSGIAWEAHVIGLAFGFAAAPLVMRIPAKARVRSVAVDAAKLEPLATTRELRAILDDLKAADLPETKLAWLEKFAAKASCPHCGGPLRLRRSAVTSTCGWRLRF